MLKLASPLPPSLPYASKSEMGKTVVLAGIFLCLVTIE